ncbi:hypothetical protein A9G24_12200 [Gilliamella sp. App6-5]|uniref:hypothetical protein n=1 Tax=Gilliamella sp. App6-5 TaxID=3120232 RepID=UPI00080E17B2|nr:hypothetical protein [Gilliamella apicola]OCG18647.1 hypothetical protein A9G24_12200 [Gilliamella apicola]
MLKETMKIKKTTKKSAKKVVVNKLIDIKIKVKKDLSRTISALRIAGVPIAYTYDNRSDARVCSKIEFIKNYPYSSGSRRYHEVVVPEGSIFIIRDFETKQLKYLKKWINEEKIEYTRVYKKRNVVKTEQATQTEQAQVVVQATTTATI